MAKTLTLNERAGRQADYLAANADAFRVAVTKTEGGARVLDCGVKTIGGLQAGLTLAKVCLAGQGDVTLSAGEVSGVASPFVQVTTDNPLVACLAAQYAGWQVMVDGKFYGMGSGPMRALWAKEELFNDIPGKEEAPVAVGVLESRKLPNEAVINYFSKELDLPSEKITLLVAPAASMAGNMQVVARSVETALHKLHELEFDLSQILSAFGSAPLPPVGKDELQAIGRTNDAILYGGRVVLWVESDDEYLAEMGPKAPSNSSPDYGSPFASIFARYNQDFYQIDPMLFSPAEVVFHNIKTGRSQAFGKVKEDVMWHSFFAGE